jgi:hypothetical protein
MPGSSGAVGSANFDAGEAEGVDGSHLGLPQLQPRAVVQHKTQGQRCSASLGPRRNALHLPAQRKVFSTSLQGD